MTEWREFQLRFPCTLPPLRVRVNGREAQWTYDGQRLETIVEVPAILVRKRNVVSIEFGETNEIHLSGTKRKFDVLFGFSKYLSDTRSYRKQDVWNDALYSSGTIMEAAQTGLRISAHPASARTELERFSGLWKQVLEMTARVSLESKNFKPYYDLMKECDD
jgi:hypothetical protein